MRVNEKFVENNQSKQIKLSILYDWGSYMVMSWIWSGMVLASLLCSMWLGRGGELSAAVVKGAQAGVELGISMAGAICLWCGAGRVMEKAGFLDALARLLKPLLHVLFPGSRRDAALARDLSANISANFLGMGNAATPMGISAARRMKRPDAPELATDELCRLIVLNTASIQLIPGNVAAVRSSLGCATPFDILPAVWLTSAASAGLGIGMAWVLGKVWAHD